MLPTDVGGITRGLASSDRLLWVPRMFGDAEAADLDAGAGRSNGPEAPFRQTPGEIGLFDPLKVRRV